MASIVLKSLSVLLGLFFIFVGFIKLSSYISKDLHKDLVRFFASNFFLLHNRYFKFLARCLREVCLIANIFPAPLFDLL